MTRNGDDSSLPAVLPSCFVMMPISDPLGYEPGHFDKVYTTIIQPACKEAGVQPLRADEESRPNYIILDILRKAIESNVAVCDISARNPNVFYELGIRHAFDRPVILIKDRQSPTAFDIVGFRYIEYDELLTYDGVLAARRRIAESIILALRPESKALNSLVSVLDIRPAQAPDVSKLSPTETLLLNAIEAVNDRLGSVERQLRLPSLGHPEEIEGARKRILAELLRSSRTADAVVAFFKHFAPEQLDILAQRRILWVYGDPELVASARASFRELGIGEDLVTSVDGAILSLDKQKPDYVITDAVITENESALDLLDRLKHLTNEVPPVAVYTNRDLKQAGDIPQKLSLHLSSTGFRMITVDASSLLTWCVSRLLGAQ